MEEVLGTQTVSMYNASESFVAGFGMTFIGLVVIFILLSIFIRPIFYLLFSIKLTYQGIREVFRFIRLVFRSIVNLCHFIYNEYKEHCEKQKRPPSDTGSRVEIIK